ncbi:MAG: hypothetical protein ACRDJH_11515, partial [Thermomicrobiales bacterium]
MDDARHERRQTTLYLTDELFAWRGGEIVLFGEWSDARWVLARGWPAGDRLTDVRRWHFGSRERFVAQVLRLVRDATGRETDALHARDAAVMWTTRCAGARFEPVL